MALDRFRNGAYEEALRRVITPESVVLDLGAGVGILGLMAARMGARRVYLVEPEDVIAVAEECVRVNGLENVVRCLHGRIEDVTIPEQVDVIVSVFTGNLLVTEDLLPHLFHARDTYLKPSGVMIPERGTIEIAPVTAAAFHRREIEDWSAPQADVTLAPARQYAANNVFYRFPRHEVSYLGEPISIHAADFYTDGYLPVRAHVEVPVHTSGICHAFAGWFKMQIGERWLSTAPDAPETHWAPALFPLDPPVVCSSGDLFTVRVDRPPYGDWSWRVTCGGTEQRHSTMLAAALKSTTLRKAAADYEPQLNQEGEAVAFVLRQCDGRTRLRDIVAQVHERWPSRFRNEEDARRFVQGLMKRLT